MVDSALIIANLTSPAVICFVIGAFSALVKSDLRVPPQVHETISMYLLFAIGLKGGIALSETNFNEVLRPMVATLFLGVTTPIIAYVLARRFGKLDVINAAAIAAHFGSVSAVTFMASLNFVEQSGASYEGFLTALLVVMEIPGIVIALAIAGMLAYKAFGNYQQQKAAGGNASVVDAVKTSAAGMATQANSLISGLLAGNQAQNASLPSSSAIPANADLPLAIIRAMIGAAKADGHMDATESQKIIGQLESAGIGTQEKALLMQEMANTQDVHTIAAAAKTPQEAVQLYLAALLVCDSQCAAEQQYLASLASSLKLEPAFTASLQQELLAMAQQKAA